MSEPVAIVPCASYDREVVRAALTRLLAPIGGLDWVRPGMKIILKPNLVIFFKPEAAATTHPSIVAELTAMLVERGAQVLIGDSPGGLYNNAFLERVYRATGMAQAVEAGAQLNRDFSQKQAVFPEALAAKNFAYTGYLDDADAIINICKLKSHGLMALSAAVKNMFGAVPGTIKPEYHYRFPHPRDFAAMLIDLNRYFPPGLCICDAVVAMEGNGPTQGTPRQMGQLLASACPHALDLACAHLIGLSPAAVPTLVVAREQDLIPDTVEELTVHGDLTGAVAGDFEKVAATHGLSFGGRLSGTLGRVARWVMRKALGSVPIVVKPVCVGCAECETICPAKAIVMKKRLPVINRKACISCFCCQEFCPKGALRVKRPLLARVLNK
ncbi:MAG: DUF362 domain-containing protein [Clostridiales bacterium]|nr:DUF362 domain-containing protein [Clostridiales bacterium]